MYKTSKHTNLHDFIDDYFSELKRCLEKFDRLKIEKTIQILLTAYKRGKSVYIIGNGGSAGTASHMACDLGKGTLRRVYDEEEKRFRVLSLTDNVPILTAFGNDLSYEDIFVQQLRNLIEKDDVLIVLSGSGNSPNIIKAVRYAKKQKATTIGFLGFKNGGKVAPLLDCAIVADSMHYGPCEDIQLILNHIVTSWIARVKHLHDGNHK